MGGKKQSPEIIGEAYRELQKLLKKYAAQDVNILLIGERGTGKEVFAKFFFASSARAGKKMTINCSGLSDSLLRSEVFGHVKGSFTDAHADRKGKIETCENGILFLDELGDASTEFQAVILRVAQGDSYSRVGEDKERTANTLIIAATNKPGALRSDLKDRFQLVYVPPLQKWDIPALAEHFLGNPLRPEVLNELVSREYPGNVRELKKTCEQLRAVKGEEIFSKRGISPPKEVSFDYFRFEREYRLWHKYIQPLIDEHKWPDDIRYIYTTTPMDSDESLDDIMRDPLSANLKTIIRQLRYDKGAHIREIVGQLSLVEVADSLREVVRGGHLPNLLRNLGQEDDNGMLQDDAFLRPDLSPLLDISNYNEARRKFERTYLAYYLEKNERNKTRTAQCLGMSPSTLNRKMKELGLQSYRNAPKTSVFEGPFDIHTEPVIVRVKRSELDKILPSPSPKPEK